MPILRVDQGGIKFVLKGSHVFCAGFTSEGGDIPESLDAFTPVQVMAEGKELALAVGLTTMSTDEMKAKNEGVGVEVMTFLGDALWEYKGSLV